MDAAILQNYPHKALVWLLVLSLVCVAMLPATLTLADAIGGYMSETLMGRAGVADSSLLIERAGVLSPALDVGMGPIVTTQAASGIGSTSATLHGTLTDLNGFPQSEVYFEWGYDLTYGNVAGGQTLAAPGVYSTAIAGLSSGATVHFRSVGDLDGTNYGSDESFVTPAAPSMSGADTTVFQFLPLVFAVFGIVLLFVFRGNATLMLVTGFVTVSGVVILMQLVNSLF